MMGLAQEPATPTSWPNRVEAVKYLNDLLASRTGFSGFKPQLAYDEEKGELKKVTKSQGASPMNQSVKLDGASVEQVSDIVVQVRSEGSLLKIAFDPGHVPNAMTAFQFLVSATNDQTSARTPMAAETGNTEAQKIQWTREFVEAQKLESQRVADPAYIAAETERAEVAWKCADLIQREFKNRPILQGTVYFNANSGLVHPAENTSRSIISLIYSRAICCERWEAHTGGVGLVLKGIEHLKMHSSFQNCVRLASADLPAFSRQSS